MTTMTLSFSLAVTVKPVVALWYPSFSTSMDTFAPILISSITSPLVSLVWRISFIYTVAPSIGFDWLSTTRTVIITDLALSIDFSDEVKDIPVNRIVTRTKFFRNFLINWFFRFSKYWFIWDLNDCTLHFLSIKRWNAWHTPVYGGSNFILSVLSFVVLNNLMCINFTNTKYYVNMVLFFWI